MRRKVLFISHELLEQLCGCNGLTFNTEVLTDDIAKYIMAHFAERAEWTAPNGMSVFITDGIPQDAIVKAMARSFERHGWLFLLEAESFPEVQIGATAPEIQPMIHVIQFP